jgi:uncharacterized lipoprotein YbaY
MVRTVTASLVVLVACPIATYTGVVSGRAGQASPLTITGSLTYRARLTLPPESSAVVELRDAAAPPGTPVVAEQRIDLKGRQIPIGFELVVDRAKLAVDKRYVVRGGILSRARPLWVSTNVAVDVSTPNLDVGALTLTQVRVNPVAHTR